MVAAGEENAVVHADMNRIETEGRIAVIGMAGRFPGAPDVATFWDNLRNGVESIEPLTEEQLLANGESAENIADPGYVRATASLADIDKFDAAFFGMSPRDAAVFDPQHRVFLECAWETFEDAGYVGSRIDGPVGVFASCGLSEYMFNNVLANAAIKESVGEWLIRHTGNDTNFLATRTSYELDLHGPSLNVQTACSSTLVAIHLACQSLLNGECDVALAGGAVISPIQGRGYFYKEGEILSPDGHCRAFDADSAGTVASSAAGCVLLKPLAAALEDGDTIHAVIRGSAINNDGRAKVGYLAPSVSGQAAVISEALAVADLDARDVSYVEMHGTGTLIGDPIEVAGLTDAFRQSTDDVGFCAIGSVKPNIGHAGEAAGIASFIKTVLALEHAEIPANLHYRNPNPQADFPSSPFFVNDRLREWVVEPGQRRIAGVTGLGAGGTNAHVILEEPPPGGPSAPPQRAEQLVVLSARTRDGVARAATDLAAHLRAHPDVALADVAFTRLSGRVAFRHRRAVVATTPDEAATALESTDPTASIGGDHTGGAPSVVFMMPGGGAQYFGMGAGLYREPAYAEAIDAACHHLLDRHGIDLHHVLVSPDRAVADDAALQRPSLALPALFTVEYATARLLESWGITPTAMIGHSAGEYVVACLAGVISLEDGLDLITLRGRLFETLPTGRMLSVSLPEAELRARIPASLSIAAINGPTLCVASGPEADVEALQAALEAEEIDCARVPIDVAAHSAMLEPILDEFRRFCRTVPFKPPALPYVSNLTGTWVSADDVTDPEYWVRHLRESVRFADGLATILADSNRMLVEVGPGRTLSGLARLAGGARPAGITNTLRHAKDTGSDTAFLLGALGRMWCAGVELDPADLFEGEARRRVPLPTYPFDRQSYWIDPDPVSPSRTSAASLRKLSDVADWFSVPSWHRTVAPAPTDTDGVALEWMLIVDGGPLTDPVARELAAVGQHVTIVEFGERFAVTEERRFTVDPSRQQDWSELCGRLEADGHLPDRILHMSAIGASRGRKSVGRASLRISTGTDPIAAFDATVSRDYSALLLLAQALSVRATPMRLAVVTSGVHDVTGAAGKHAERALLHGATRVIPRELGTTAAIAIDIDDEQVAATSPGRLAARVVREIRSEPVEDLVVLRGSQRWVRAFDAVPVPTADRAPWRSDGTYLITGGLGGIGLTIAAHVAERAPGACVVLIGRSGMPAEDGWDALLASDAAPSRVRHQIETIRAIRARGSQVTVIAADVTDVQAMTRAVESVEADGRSITGVIHAAGILQDALIALRNPQPLSPVVDVKVRGALVLDRVLAHRPPEFVVLCSSVSSILGLPGQADYTGASAFLDAFATQRQADGHSRYVSVNWSAWQEVGMAVDAVDAAVARGGGTPAGSRATARRGHALLESIDDDGARVTGETAFDRNRHWLVGEHVVHGGGALIPGTGYLELIREAAAVGLETTPAVELRDVFFLAAFFVGEGEARPLRVDLERASGAVAVYSETATAPHVTATACAVVPEPVERHDVAAIRSRCSLRSEIVGGHPDQVFMDFGPRWANIDRIDFGDREALVSLRMPGDYVAELAELWLHPAVLDMATGSGQALIPGYSRDETFFVPFSYGRVLSRRAMPTQLLSHIRLREAGAETAVFDVTLMDEAGDEIASIDGFMMRLTTADSAITGATQRTGRASPSAVANPIEAAIREGIRPAEGADALDRVLAHDLGAQVVVSAIDLPAWVAKIDAEAESHDDIADAPPFGRPELGSDFEAPATQIEGELAAIWRDLLGVGNVGRHDDFFELGGQSLIAVRLFTRIRKRYDIDLPLATLFEAPTIAECAAVIASRLGIEDAPAASDAAERSGEPAAPVPPVARLRERPVSEFRSLVTIQRGGGRIPYFCVHGAGGNVLNFRDMSRAMGHDQPFYGLQARGIDGVLRPRESIEEMAAAYLAEVRTVQPEGPYVFGGYSGGGIVAYEMARQATAAGTDVALVVLLDTIPVTTDQIHITNAMRAKRMLHEPLRYLSQMVIRRQEQHRYDSRMAQLDDILARDEPVPTDLREMHLERALGRAAASYELRPYDGRVVLIRASDPHFVFDALGESYGWERIVGHPIEILRVPGNHDTVMLEPNASVLVRLLREVLDSTLQPA